MLKWCKQLLQTVFKIEPAEFTITALMFTYLLAATGAFIVSRITRDVLFMDIANFKAMLPYTYVAVAITVSVAMALYAKVERKLRRDKTNLITLTCLIVIMLVSRYFLTPGNSGDWFKWVFYVLVELSGSFLIVQFWSLANEIFYSRQAKRLFAVIGAGGVLANIVAGFGVKALATTIGTNNMTLVIAGLMAIAMLMVRLVARNTTDILDAARQKQALSHKTAVRQVKHEREPIFASRHLKTIAMIVVITYLVSTMVDYQFKAVLGDAIPGSDDRSAFYGLFFGITGILSATIQLFLTGRILERFGVLISLLLLPMAMLSGSIGLLIYPALFTAVMTKGSENVLRYTITDATMQLLYLPVPAAQRGRAKAFIDGVLKPIATGGAGLILLLFTSNKVLALFGVQDINVRYISGLVIALLITWALLLFRLKGEYISSLLNTLQRRRLDFSDSRLRINDDNTLKVVSDALCSDKRGYVLHAFELLPFVEKTNKAIQQAVLKLLTNPDPTIRIAALNYLTVADFTFNSAVLIPHLHDSNEEARAAAIRAYCSRAKIHSVDLVEEALADESPLVQGAAVSALIRFGGLDGILRCAETLKKMLSSPDHIMRERGAWVLGDINVKTFYQPLLPLLADPDERVRAAAIEAAGKLVAPELIPTLVDLLASNTTAGKACNALCNYGSAIEKQLLAIFEDRETAPAIREVLPKVLAKIGHRDSATTLQRYLDDPHYQLRASSIRALNQLLSNQPGILADEQRIRECLANEVQEIYENMARQLDLGLQREQKSDLLLLDTFEQRRRAAIDRIFKLLNLIYPGSTLDMVYNNVCSNNASTRSNAIELLDNMLDNSDKALVLPLLETADYEKLLKGAPHKVLRQSCHERLQQLLKQDDPWLVSCALYYVGHKKLPDFLSEVQKALLDNQPPVRQTALWALTRIAPAEILQSAIKTSRKDKDPLVKNYADSLINLLKEPTDDSLD